MHLFVDRVERAHVEQAATDAGLVRRDDDAVPGVVEPRDGFHAARDGAPFIGALDVLVAVEIEHAIAIEDDQLGGACRHHGFGGELDHVHQAASFEISATRFIVAATLRNKARRLARTVASSAMTITASKKRSTTGLTAASDFSAPA